MKTLAYLSAEALNRFRAALLKLCIILFCFKMLLINEFCVFIQPLRLDIKRKLSARSDRVKCSDLHPSEPWMLISLYNGNVHIWNHESQVILVASSMTRKNREIIMMCSEKCFCCINFAESCVMLNIFDTSERHRN